MKNATKGSRCQLAAISRALGLTRGWAKAVGRRIGGPVCSATGRVAAGDKVAFAGLLVGLAGMIVALSLREFQIAVLLFQGVVTTALAWVTYRYVRSADVTARATVELARAAKDQVSFLESQRDREERVALQEVLQELMVANRQEAPPFEVSALERHLGRITEMKGPPYRVIEAVITAHAHMTNVGAHYVKLRDRVRGARGGTARQGQELRDVQQTILRTIQQAIVSLSEYLHG